jgi:hypothetical protein
VFNVDIAIYTCQTAELLLGKCINSTLSIDAILSDSRKSLFYSLAQLFLRLVQRHNLSINVGHLIDFCTP